MAKRVFLIVLDSVGIGELPDAYMYGDSGSNTLKSVRQSQFFDMPNMEKLGLFNIDGVGGSIDNPFGSFARMNEKSKGKDTTIGHWEIAGIISNNPLPTYPNGFPDDIIKEFEMRCNVKTICNKVYSGTEVIKDYGIEHIKTGKLIVYTSADSVFQIAAHEDIVPIEKLYEYCKIAREILVGDNAVGRIIARPFIGEYPFKRTSNRHDFSLNPPKKTMLDYLKEEGKEVISVGKINDIFASHGITQHYSIKNNQDGMNRVMDIARQEFDGLCFVNLVDFDMVFGHRNDVDGYAKALSEFDIRLGELLKLLLDEDILIITADHGCDPSTQSTDHSREYVPMVIYGNNIKSGVNLNTRDSFSDVSASILSYFGIKKGDTDNSFLDKVLK